MTIVDPDQQDMFAAREAAIEQADLNADEHWKLEADRIIKFLADCFVPFTSDDMIDRLEQAGVTTHNLAALGGVFRRAAAAGLIRKTGRLVPSRIPRRHRDLTEWIGRDPF